MTDDNIYFDKLPLFIFENYFIFINTSCKTDSEIIYTVVKWDQYQPSLQEL